MKMMMVMALRMMMIIALKFTILHRGMKIVKTIVMVMEYQITKMPAHATNIFRRQPSMTSSQSY